jgi:hypothetical protein
MALACSRLGNLYSDQGKLMEAEQMYERALRGYEKALGAEHISTVTIANKLKHLARFRMARDLGNKACADSFRKPFVVQIFSNGKYFDPECWIDVEDGAIVELAVENRGDDTLYVCVHDLGSSWKVANLLLMDPLIAFTPQHSGQGGKIRLHLMMTIAAQMGRKDVAHTKASVGFQPSLFHHIPASYMPTSCIPASYVFPASFQPLISAVSVYISTLLSPL